MKSGEMKHEMTLYHNLDLLKAHLHTQTNHFLEKNLDLDLIPCISKPTRITKKTATLIDNVMVSPKLQSEMSPHLIVEDISDHLPILILLRNQNKSLKECKVIKSRNLNDTRLDRINSELKQIDWDELLGNIDVSAGFLKFHSMLCRSIDKHASEVQRKVNYKKVVRDPWITHGIMNSLAKQRHMFKAQLKGDVSTFNYRWYRNEL